MANNMTKKKRTKAERSAAAKASWARRRAAAAMDQAGVPKAQGPTEGQFLREAGAGSISTSTVTAVATKEGAEYFLTLSFDGTVLRHKVSETLLRKLALDALSIVG